MLLLLLAPASSAAVPNHTITAPYTGSVSNSNSWSVAGCAKAKVVTPSTFSLTHGMGTSAYTAAAKTCRGSFGSNQYSAGYASGGSTVGVKLKVAVGGMKTVVANWTFTVSGFQNVSMAPCAMAAASSYSYCDQYASAYVGAYAWLVDLKTGATVYSNNYFYETNASYNDSYCYNGTCYTYVSGLSPGGFSGSFGAFFSFSLSMNARHTYALFTAIYVGADVAFYTYGAHFVGGAHGTAAVDMASGGQGAVLNSISIT